MATMTTTGTIRNPKLTVTLALSINHMVYTVVPIDHNDNTITRAFRLTKKHDRTIYDVAETEHGAVCDCPDWETRRNGLDPAGCKHIQALRMMGMLLLAPLIPAVEPAPAKLGRPVIIDDFYSRAQAELAAFLAGSDVETRPEPARCCQCPSASVYEEGGMPYCDGCYDRMIQTPVAPAPCCSPAETSPCVTCETATSAADVPTMILDRGIALAEAEVNLPVADVDHYDDETPELDIEPTDAERAEVATAFTAMDCQAFMDRSSEFPLEQAIDHLAVAFKGWNSPFGSMLAQVMEELAAKAFAVGATTPAELLTGLETLDREARATWERVGRESVAKPRVNLDDPTVRRGKPTLCAAYGAFPEYQPTTR